MPSLLLSPYDLGGLSLANRVAVAPMCQYSAEDGVPGDWHLVHLGQLAQGGAGLLLVEATGVTPEGRITPGCTGLWSEAQEAAFARIVAFCRRVGATRVGIQLGHSGRKGSTRPPWEGGGVIAEAEGGWRPPAPSALPYLPDWPAPEPLDAGGIARIVEAFAAAAARAARAGFEAVEIHAAHGYLLHQFLSPLTNRRGDRWGGARANRMRFPLAVIEAVRAAFPADRPVLLRVSATDWIAGGWDLDDTIALAREAKALGVALIDVSSGGIDQRQRLVAGPGYQTGFAAAVRAGAGIATMAVGQITEAAQAETILRTGQADMVALARGMLWNPRWVWHAALALGEEPPELPVPYARAHPAARGRPFVTRK